MLPAQHRLLAASLQLVAINQQEVAHKGIPPVTPDAATTGTQALFTAPTPHKTKGMCASPQQWHRDLNQGSLGQADRLPVVPNSRTIEGISQQQSLEVGDLVGHA